MRYVSFSSFKFGGEKLRQFVLSPDYLNRLIQKEWIVSKRAAT